MKFFSYLITFIALLLIFVGMDYLNDYLGDENYTIDFVRHIIVAALISFFLYWLRVRQKSKL